MLLTRDNIHATATENCGWNKEQLELLGVVWPPQKGWLSNLVGREMLESDYQKVMVLRSMRSPKERKALLASLEIDYVI